MLLAALVGCAGLDDDPWWVDGLAADSPCYRVDLGDGLDIASTAEAHDLFGCLDRYGHLDAFAPLDAALDVPTRAGDPVGIELARVVGHLGEVDVDAFALADVLLAALTAEDRPVDELLDLSLELAYGAPAADVRAGTAAALDDGLVAPLRAVVPVAASALLRDDTDAAAFAGELLLDPETARWIRTVASVAETDDPAVAGPRADLLVHLGEAIARSRSPSDDRWPGASGDSLRDLATFFVVRDNPVVDEISPAVDAMLSDPLVLDALVPSIDRMAAQGHLAPLGEQLAWLASVDTAGRPLEGAEPSALYRFVRLLAENNRDIHCSVLGLGFTIDNLAVWTLGVVADLTPGQVRTLASLVDTIAGIPFGADILELAGGAVCDELDDLDQTFDDLESLETLQQPETRDLLAVFVEVLGVLEDGQQDHLPAFADLGEALFDAGGLEPAEEAIRDLGGAAVTSDVLTLLPVLVHPEDHGIAAGDEPANDLADLLAIARWAFAVDPEHGLTGFQRLRPLVAPVLGHDDTWRLLGNAGRLLADERSEASRALELLPVLVALDPDLDVPRHLGPLLADEALSAPLLRVAEREEVADALLASSGEREVPLAFWGRLVVSGALEDLLRLVDVLLDALD